MSDVDRTKLDRTIETRINRRKLLHGAGLMGVGAALAGCVPATVAQTAAAAKPNVDEAVLNFALNLEYLEAEFYLRAAFGRGLADADTAGAGTRGNVVGGRKVAFANPAVQQYAEEIAIDEENHVRFLRSALGAKAVARPTIDIGPAFAAAGAAASNNAIQGFDPYANDLFFLHGAFVFEDVGVSAYAGAAALITSPAFLTAAAGILAVEAYHAGTIRTLLHQARTTVAAAGLTVEQIVGAISDLRDKVDGPGDTDQGIVLDGRANLVNADANSVAFTRTTAQVLNIVYLGDRVKPGGFFPNGLNGAIR